MPEFSAQFYRSHLRPLPTYGQFGVWEALFMIALHLTAQFDRPFFSHPPPLDKISCLTAWLAQEQWQSKRTSQLMPGRNPILPGMVLQCPPPWCKLLPPLDVGVDVVDPDPSLVRKAGNPCDRECVPVGRAAAIPRHWTSSAWGSPSENPKGLASQLLLVLETKLLQTVTTSQSEGLVLDSYSWCFLATNEWTNT